MLMRRFLFAVIVAGLVSAANAQTPNTTKPSLINMLTANCTAAQMVVGSATTPACGPAAATAGDIVYFNGTNFVVLPGNNSGTKFLQETAAGVPSWATVSGSGTVTSVTCGTGLTGGTFTTTGTCAVSLTSLTNSLSADVALSNTSNYFPGPTVAQGTSGTWFASGSVALTDSVATSGFFCKLWDGTTVIASGWSANVAANSAGGQSLSGILASPAGNIRIDCRDASATTGTMKFNTTGNSKDSTISVFRIQ